MLTDLIASRRDLLATPEYSQDAQVRCERCLSTATFPLVNPNAILSVLGYC